MSVLAVLLPTTCLSLGLGLGIMVGQTGVPVRHQRGWLLWTAWGLVGGGFVCAVWASVWSAT